MKNVSVNEFQLGRQQGDMRGGQWGTTATPALVLVTRHGFVPALPGELCDDMVRQEEEEEVAVVAIPLREVVDWETDLRAAGGVKKFCGLKDSTRVIIVGEDLLAPFANGKITEKRVLLETVRGQRDLAPADFVRLVEVLRADLVAYPTNEPVHSGSGKSQDKSVNGVLRFMDACKMGVDPTMMGVIGGGANDKMRQWSCEQTVARGALHVMFAGIDRAPSFEEALRVVRLSISLLPADRMRFVQGCFDGWQVEQLIRAGVDLVSTSYPVQKSEAGIGLLFPQADLDLNDRKNMTEKGPIDPSCKCSTCRNHSRAYICHLLAVEEMLATTLLAVHNTHRFLDLCRRLRQEIKGTE